MRLRGIMSALERLITATTIPTTRARPGKAKAIRALNWVLVGRIIVYLVAATLFIWVIAAIIEKIL
jgi:hypothetical protein